MAASSDARAWLLLRFLPRPDRWSVAVEDLGLVLVPRAGRPVRVHHQRPAPPVNDDLVVERAQQDAVLDGRLAAVGLVLGVVHLAAPAGWVQPPAHWQCRSRSSTALRIPAGIVSEYPMSSGRLGPPSRTPSSRRRRKLASPPGPDSRSTALPITACSTAAHAAVVPSRRARAVAALAELVQLDAEPDQVLMGIWQATANQVRSLEPLLEMAGPACQVNGFPGLAAEAVVRIAGAGRCREPVP